jgi:hypothetical protein
MATRGRTGLRNYIVRFLFNNTLKGWCQCAAEGDLEVIDGDGWHYSCKFAVFIQEKQGLQCLSGVNRIVR